MSCVVSCVISAEATSIDTSPDLHARSSKLQEARATMVLSVGDSCPASKPLVAEPPNFLIGDPSNGTKYSQAGPVDVSAKTWPPPAGVCIWAVGATGSNPDAT